VNGVVRVDKTSQLQTRAEENGVAGGKKGDRCQNTEKTPVRKTPSPWRHIQRAYKYGTAGNRTVFALVPPPPASLPPHVRPARFARPLLVGAGEAVLGLREAFSDQLEAMEATVTTGLAGVVFVVLAMMMNYSLKVSPPDGCMHPPDVLVGGYLAHRRRGSRVKCGGTSESASFSLPVASAHASPLCSFVVSATRLEQFLQDSV
jgi:hypothetical protein